MSTKKTLCDDEPSRDIRIDRIWMVDQLQKHFADDLREDVKLAHAVGTRLTGDLCDGLIIGTSKTELSVSKWFNLFEIGQIDRKQFLSALSVSPSESRKILSEKVFAKISSVLPGKSQLRISGKKGVDISLVDAVREIGATIALRVPPVVVAKAA